MAEAAAEVRLPYPSNYIGALTYAFGKELQYLDGAPHTIARGNFLPGDTELLVISTFGFPNAGTVASNGYQITYTGKTEDSFTGISGVRALAVPLGAKVALRSSLILPPTYNLNPNA